MSERYRKPWGGCGCHCVKFLQTFCRFSIPLCTMHTHVHTCTYGHNTYACTYTHIYTCTSIYCTYTHTYTHHSKESMNRCSIRFILGNVSMRAMHYAVDQLDLEVLYGTQSATPAASPAGIKRCLDDLAKLELYDKQKNAIRGMLEPLYQKVCRDGVYMCVCVGCVCTCIWLGYGVLRCSDENAVIT